MENNILALRNYSSLNIYNYIKHKHPELTPEEHFFKIKIIFKQLINNIRLITHTPELNHYHVPMAFLFQHIKPNIIKLVANCSPPNEKIFLDSMLINNLEWNKKLFLKLASLEAKDIMLWFFFHIPYYNNSTHDILSLRNNYIQMLDWAKTNWPKELYFKEHEFVFISNETCMPYAASYHNMNNKLLLTKYCSLIREICPWVNYFSPNLAQKYFDNQKKQKQIQNNNFTFNDNDYCNYDANYNDNTSLELLRNDNEINRKIKVCFISDSFVTDTSVLRDRVSIIGKLDRSKYDVYFASFFKFEAISGIIAKIFMSKIKNNYIYLGNSLEAARSQLEQFEFDIIIYPDIGMKLLPTLLAYSRIAPIQITTWGHSETSGIDTIDYFITSRYFILDGGNEERTQEQYSEKCIFMRSLGTYYISPHKLFITNNPDRAGKPMKTRSDYGFSITDHLYCCLQTFYKFNENFERTLAMILGMDPNGVILVSNTYPFCKSHLTRMRNIMGAEKVRRIRWFPSMEKDEFLNLVSICDVCLDPFPFGGCNTSYDAFDYNIPVITMPSEFLHGRFTYGLYAKMGLDECIVANEEEYAQMAVSVAVNEKLRHKINRNIEMNKEKIFQEQESVDEWNSVLSELFVKQ